MNHKEKLVQCSSEELVGLFGNKSNAIRYLTSYGFTKGEVSKMLGIRYQHVRNVLLQKLNKDVVIQDIESKISDIGADKDQLDLFGN